MNTILGFIGCGNMGGALVRAAAKTVAGDQIYLCDHNPEKTAVLAKETGGHICTSPEAAEICDWLFLGVKPQMMRDMFEEILPSLKKRTKPILLISMAAGVSIADIEAMSGLSCKIIRIMPNTPCAVGAGTILYCANAAVEDTEITEFCRIMQGAGAVEPIDEKKIDAASAISGCGPAFVCLFAEALADGGVACGLTREKANAYAAQVLEGTAKLLLAGGQHPGSLKDAVCSPGGTTIAGVLEMENRAFRAAASQAVIAAYEKTLKLKH